MFRALQIWTVLFLLGHNINTTFFRTAWYENPNICGQIPAHPKVDPHITSKSIETIRRKLSSLLKHPNSKDDSLEIKASSFKHFKPFFQLQNQINQFSKKYQKYMIPLTRIFSSIKCSNLSTSIVGKASVWLSLKSNVEIFNVNHIFREFAITSKKMKHFIKPSNLMRFVIKVLKYLTNFIKLYVIMLKEGYFMDKEALNVEDLIILKKTHSLFFREINHIRKIKNQVELKERISTEISKIEQLIKQVLEKVEISVLKHSPLEKSINETFFDLHSLVSASKIRKILNNIYKISLKKSICEYLNNDLRAILKFKKGMKNIFYYSYSFPFHLSFKPKLMELIEGISSQKTPERRLEINRLAHRPGPKYFRNYLKYLKKRKATKHKRRKHHSTKSSKFIVKGCVRAISSSIRPTIKFFKRFKPKNDFFSFSLDKRSDLVKGKVKIHSLKIKSFFWRFKQLQIISTLAYLLKG